MISTLQYWIIGNNHPVPIVLILPDESRRIKKKAAGEIRRHFSSLPFHYVKFPGACLSRSNLVLFGFLLSLLRDIQSGFARPVIFEDDAGIHNDDAFALRID